MWLSLLFAGDSDTVRVVVAVVLLPVTVILVLVLLLITFLCYICYRRKSNRYGTVCLVIQYFRVKYALVLSLVVWELYTQVEKNYSTHESGIFYHFFSYAVQKVEHIDLMEEKKSTTLL